jgi:hypothetical protein
MSSQRTVSEAASPRVPAGAAPGPDRAAASRTVPWESLGRWGPLFRLEELDPGAPARFLTEVQTTPEVPRTILLETTLSWGCACPTWAFPFYGDLDKLKYVMVLPASSIEGDPTDFALPGARFRMSGRFSGEALTGLEWVEARGKRPPSFPKGALDGPEVQEYWIEPGLAFLADSWCYERDSIDPEDISWLRDQGAVACGD